MKERKIKGWVPVTERGRPFYGHFKKAKADLPKTGWVKHKAEDGDTYSRVVDLFPARATLIIEAKP